MNEVDMVMFLVFRAGNDESPIYNDEVPASRADKTEKRIMSVYGTEEFEVYRAKVKRLLSSQKN